VLPESINKRVESLFQKNVDLYEAWNQFDNDKTLSVSDELLHFFQMENLKEISLSEKVPLAFYFLSLVLLLATFFFIFKSKQ
jgi:2-polyprenyl-6-methoxyphenol hydroxylase-like FAD-dependent oxidoreductase